MIRQFTEEKITANKYIEKYTLSIAFREIKIKTTIKYYNELLKLVLKKLKVADAGNDVGKGEHCTLLTRM